MTSYYQPSCYGCGGPLDGFLCRRCTCEWCGNNLKDGFCSFCNSRAGNSFIYDSNPNSFDNPPDFSYHPPQPQYETYSCPHYSSDCQTRNQLVYEPSPSNNYDFPYFDQSPQYHIDQSPPQDLDFYSRFKLLQMESDLRFKEMLRPLKTIPLVGVGEPEGSDDYTEVTLDEE
ncbi:hypothetical protein Tco_1337635 [Tanacetum coccineum]